jgi:hypothetical protein
MARKKFTKRKSRAKYKIRIPRTPKADDIWEPNLREYGANAKFLILLKAEDDLRAIPQGGYGNAVAITRKMRAKPLFRLGSAPLRPNGTALHGQIYRLTVYRTARSLAVQFLMLKVKHSLPLATTRHPFHAKI